MSSIMFSAFSAFVSLPTLYRSPLCWYGIYGSDFFLVFPQPCHSNATRAMKRVCSLFENKWVRSYTASVKMAQQVVFVWLRHEVSVWADSVGCAEGQRTMHSRQCGRFVCIACPMSQSGISISLFSFISHSLFYYYTHIVAPELVTSK